MGEIQYDARVWERAHLMSDHMDHIFHVSVGEIHMTSDDLPKFTRVRERACL
jgi:hypothetical protein